VAFLVPLPQIAIWVDNQGVAVGFQTQESQRSAALSVRDIRLDWQLCDRSMRRCV